MPSARDNHDISDRQRLELLEYQLKHLPLSSGSKAQERTAVVVDGNVVFANSTTTTNANATTITLTGGSLTDLGDGEYGYVSDDGNTTQYTGVTNVTDNGDGTWTISLGAGSTATTTITADTVYGVQSYQGSDITAESPAALPTVAAGATVTPGSYSSGVNGVGRAKIQLGAGKYRYVAVHVTAPGFWLATGQTVRLGSPLRTETLAVYPVILSSLGLPT